MYFCFFWDLGIFIVFLLICLLSNGRRNVEKVWKRKGEKKLFCKYVRVDAGRRNTSQMSSSDQFGFCGELMRLDDLLIEVGLAASCRNMGLMWSKYENSEMKDVVDRRLYLI